MFLNQGCGGNEKNLSTRENHKNGLSDIYNRAKMKVPLSILIKNKLPQTHLKELQLKAKSSS